MSHTYLIIGATSGIGAALAEESDWVTGQVMHVDGGLSSLRG